MEHWHERRRRSAYRWQRHHEEAGVLTVATAPKPEPTPVLPQNSAAALLARLKHIRACTLEDAEVWQPVADRLAQHGIATLGELADTPRSEIADIKGFGPKKLKELDDTLARYGLNWKYR